MKRFCAMLPLLVSCVAAPGTAAEVAGTIFSTAPFTMDSTRMDPAAAPAWPVTKGSEIANSAPAVLVTEDKNRLTFGRDSGFKLGTVQGVHTYVFLRKGGVGFETGENRIYICAAGRLFVPPPAAVGKWHRGYVRLDAKPNTVVRYLEKAEFEEDGRRGCDEAGILAAAGAAGGIISGAAAGGGALTTAGIGAGVVAGGAVATSSLLPGATFKNTCTDPAGCALNPVAVSPIQP